jgi:beta-glucosidase
MTDILRNQWKFTGYVTSDCWAIDDFFRYHKTHKDATSSAVDAVMHGTDVECGQTVYKMLVDAVKTGLIKEEQLNISLQRLFMIRLRLGMFDPVSMVKYAQTPASVLESPEHKAHSLKMAQQAIVLLKNENNTLPLSKKIKKIAVLGPNADNSVSVLGNYNGIPSQIVTALQGIKDKLGNNAEVVFEPAINFTNDTVLAYTDVDNQYSFDGKKGFKAEYFNNKELKGDPVVQNEGKLDHFWQEGQAVVGSITASNFSARYTANFTAANDGDITFELDGDDGYRLLVNDKEQINTWTRNRFGARTYKLNTKKDSTYKVVIEYWQGEGKANIRLRAGHFERTDFIALANRIKDADAIIYVGGISPQLEGEEMRVEYAGFNGGDRTTILLPKIQTELMKALKTTSKPVVFVMMTGSAIAFPWENENIPAILNAWYGGQSAGTAIANVLFGDYNPAGRLPVTFYKNDSDLPDFSSYSMENRTYRYFKGDPLYGFGYGLSYTNFHYDQLKLPATATVGRKIMVSARVTNTGKKDGEEVVELYVRNENKIIKSPLKALKGFQRISLKAGQSKQVQFQLNPQDLSVADDKGVMRPLKGKIMISVGGGQPGEKNKTTSDVVKGNVMIN